MKDLLRREVLDTQFRGMKEALENPDPEAMQRVKDMMADLNAMLDADARGEHTQEDFDEFMAKHGDMFPDNPANLEELVDSLARRAAAAERMMRSLSARAAPGAGRPDGRRAGGPGPRARRWPSSATALQARRPDLDWRSRERMSGDEPMGVGDAHQRAGGAGRPRRAGVDARPGLPRREPRGRRRGGRRAARSAGGAVDDLRELRRIERELERQGYLTRSGDRLELTAKAVRRLGQTALRRVFADLRAAGRGGHDVHGRGAGGRAHRGEPARGSSATSSRWTSCAP